MYSYLGTPYGYAHILNGVLLFTTVIFVIWNVANLQNIDNYQKITLLLLLSIAFGVHGISHFFIDSLNLSSGEQCNKCQKRVRFSV